MNFNKSNIIKRAVVLIVCVFMTAYSTLAVFAAESYTVSQLDDMVITLPDDMSAITRDSKSSDKYFSVFGLDYNTTMQTFKNGDIYLQGMDSSSSVTLTVTMTQTDESKQIGNYSELSADELNKVRNNFLNMGEYGSCTQDQAQKLVWLIFDVTVTSGGKQIKAYQANTVYDSMSINVTMKRNEGDVTAADYANFASIVSSVDFLRGDFTADILPLVIGGGTIIIILLIVLIIVLAKKATKRKKLHKNDAILQELASKYNLAEKKQSGYDLNAFDDNQIEEPEEQINIAPDTKTFNKAVLTQKPEIKPEYDHYDNIAEKRVSEDEIDDIIKSARLQKELSDSKSNGSDGENDRQEYEDISSHTDMDYEEDDEDNDSGEPAEAKADAEQEQTESGENSENGLADAFFGSDDDNDDSLSDEELVRQQIKRSKFDSGYDFFEEAPKKTMGVISSEEIRDAEDYDVINEVEQKAARVENEGVQEPNAAVVALKKAGAGLKNFGIHFGYFCKNLTKMIKYKRAAAKRKKAEQERRERERARAERARQRAARQNSGDSGLVRVHSRNDQRSPQNRRPQSSNRRDSRR